MASQSGVHGDDDFKCIVLHDGSVLVIERNRDGSKDLTKLDNPSGRSASRHIDAPTKKG